MQMPRLNGLDLVSRVKEQYPHIPVLLITGKGSESLAVEALSRGAASYVPKGELADKLAETIVQILETARIDTRYAKLNECLVNTHYTYYLDNDPALFPPLIDLVQQAIVGTQLCDASSCVQVGIALEEALLNSLVHGNLELPLTAWRKSRAELRKGLLPAAIEERRQAVPYRDRLILVDIQVTCDEARFVVGDEGPGFDHRRLDEKLPDEGGRGLVLIKTFMNEVRFNSRGSEITLVKRPSRPSANRKTSAAGGTSRG
jgi:CheY-like chemotaxis protein/anti-sigma regulatory factor (Ser/Thr protein kinase)